MWVRFLLDIGAIDIAHAYLRLVMPGAEESRFVEEHFSPSGKAMPCLSVRSGLTLLLETLAWPKGSEVIFSALNIPDMAMVVRHHGLVPVPADLNLHKLAPDLDCLEQAITPRTKAILIAHLYGNFIDLDPIIDIARRHNLLVIEDCAEIFDGVHPGHREADVSLFSFGPLKTATALAGGVLRTREPELLGRLEANHRAWPRQSRWDYFRRITKYGFMRLCSEPSIYGAVRQGIKLAVGDVDKMIHHSAKSFRQDDLILRLRQQPSTALLAVLERRLRTFQTARIDKRIANGRLLADLLRGAIFCPGADVQRHNYWLFPAMVDNPASAIAALEAAGFDVTQAQSMQAVPAPPDRLELDPYQAREALQKIILLPCYPEMPESELRRLAATLLAWQASQPKVAPTKLNLTDSHRAAALHIWTDAQPDEPIQAAG